MADDKDKLAVTPEEEIFQEAKKRFAYCVERESTARGRFDADLKFAEGDSDNGYQWPDNIKTNRDTDERPCLTVNRLRQHNLQIINDAKQNKMGIKIRATGGAATAKSADVFASLVRHIEYVSRAHDAYGHAFEDQVKAGIGWWRVITGFVDDETFDQECRILKIKDPKSVFMDPDMVQKDGSDARYAFVFDDVPRDVFKEQYPKLKDVATRRSNLSYGGWITKDHIRVAEYYRVVEKDDALALMDDPKTGESITIYKSRTPKQVWAYLEKKDTTRARPIKRRVVEWFKLVGDEVADRRDWPGKYIPLIRVIGEETVIDGEIDRKGHTRAMKDAQRIYNYNSPLALNTPLPTPTGWTMMGAVNVGDYLLGEDGKPVKVVGTSPIHLHRKCFRVEFDDGSHIIADEGHLWAVEEKNKVKPGGTTWDWQSKNIPTSKLTSKRHFIYVTEPVDLPDADLPIHPYVLGVWLGNGRHDGGRICFGSEDVDDMRANIAACGYVAGEPRYYENKVNAADVNIFGLSKQLLDTGLRGHNKHIPERYLRASRKQREQLLQGLMDTDGCVSKEGQCIFVNTNEAIIRGFAELLRTLGIKAVSRRNKGQKRLFPSGKEYMCQESTSFYFSPGSADAEIFKLSRKIVKQGAARQNFHKRRTKRYRILSVTQVPSVPVKCVTIDSPSHLFLAGPGMVPTHNSASVEFGALQSKSPWVGPIAAFENFENMWKNANSANYAYLPFNHIDDNDNPIPAPARPQPPQSAPAFLDGMKIAADEMRAASGQNESEMGMQGNERTGRAINAKQRQGENATYHFTDNQAVALRHTGAVLIDLIPKIYDTERVIRISDEDGAESELMVNPEMKQALIEKRNQQGMVIQRIFNPAVGKYEVQADVGPAYATQREEAFNAISLVLTQSPELTNVVGDYLFKAADFPFADKIAERLRRLVPPAALGEEAPPAVKQLEEQVKQAQGVIATMAQQLADAELKSVKKDAENVVKVYDAITKRLGIVLSTLETVYPKMAAKMAGEVGGEVVEGKDVPSVPATGTGSEGAAPGSGPTPELSLGLPEPMRQAVSNAATAGAGNAQPV